MAAAIYVKGGILILQDSFVSGATIDIPEVEEYSLHQSCALEKCYKEGPSTTVQMDMESQVPRLIHIAHIRKLEEPAEICDLQSPSEVLDASSSSTS